MSFKVKNDIFELESITIDRTVSKTVFLFCAQKHESVIYAIENVCKFYNRIRNVWVSLGNVNMVF